MKRCSLWTCESQSPGQHSPLAEHTAWLVEHALITRPLTPYTQVLLGSAQTVQPHKGDLWQVPIVLSQGTEYSSQAVLFTRHQQQYPRELARNAHSWALLQPC